MALNPKLTDWRGRVVWMIGASSGIGRATAHALHKRGAVVVVSARNAAPLQHFVDEHPGSMAVALDAGEATSVADAARRIVAQHGRLDLACYCAGHYLAQRATTFDLSEMLRHQQINYVGALNMLAAVLPGFVHAGRGHVSLVGSVAGYRGLPNSLAYGPTKAALNNLAEALYLDLRECGVGVSIINPGFVETPLTAQNRFRMPALISPDEAAAHILRGWARGAFEMNFPKRFTLWMRFLKVLPDTLYFAAVSRATGL
ncbi:MAG TPA: SDR family NAD(P)-dependent oxidoreductase [Casimicrobiaceae bacterium]|nr:SDR family NAD(P)-dependent oxidoreductase [Casimicrobiaceae bacterium]